MMLADGDRAIGGDGSVRMDRCAARCNRSILMKRRTFGMCACVDVAIDIEKTLAGILIAEVHPNTA
jgi:hypothetical protein